MAVLHEEVGAVLLERDGEGRVLGHALDDFDAFHVKFIAPGGALVGADLAGDDDAGLLRESLDGVENFGREGGLGDDSLNGSGAVAKYGEEQFAALAQVIQPALKGDAAAFVLADGGDGGEGRFGFGF